MSMAASAAHAQATLDNGAASAADLALRLGGPGITITSPVIPPANDSDAQESYGLFSNGIAGAGLQIDRGIIMSTGTVAEALTSNTAAAISEGTNTPYSDPDITAIDIEARYNVALFQFNVTLDPFITGLSINYQFGSDEYPNYVGSRFNDVFAFFVSGGDLPSTRNIAQAPLGGNVRINNINIGTVGCSDDAKPQDLSQSAFYINNGHTTALPFTCQPNPPAGPFPVVTEFNGITQRLTAEQRGLTPGQTYTVKFAVADVFDEVYDTGVFIELISGVYDQDHGDAPASYGDPEHNITSALLLGSTRTPETAAYNDPNAAGDDDDGVTLPAMTQGQTAIVTATLTGTGGFLSGWFDWDGDGNFTDAGEQVLADLADGGIGDLDGVVNGAVAFSVPVPATATTSQTFARFRFSTDTGLAPDSGEASDGEVEDYALTIASLPPPAACPTGFVPRSHTGYADTVITAAQNSTNALGAPEAAGSSATAGGISARVTNSSRTLRLRLADLVPEGATITALVARDTSTGAMNISMSDDGSAYSFVTAFNSGSLDILQAQNLTVPAGGAQFIEFQRTGGNVWIAGLEYSEICAQAAQLEGEKSVEVYDPASEGLFSLPGNDVIYTITIRNAGESDVDANTIALIDALPPELEFYYGPTPEFGNEVAGWSETGSNLFFNPATDIAYSHSPTRPASFAACTDTPIAGYDPSVKFLCVNPKGNMAYGDPDPEFSVSFRARIK